MLKPNQPYILKHHPKRWALMGGKLRPVLGKITIEAGPHPTIEACKAAAARGGFVLIQGGVEEVQIPPRKNLPRGGLHYRSAFLGGTPEAREKYYAFLDGLVESGVIAPKS